MKILVVDDSKAMRSIVMRTLRQAGYGGHTMAEACNGAEALTSIKGDAPDLVLSDWNMPEMNGIELLRALRSEGNGVRFGFITSEGTEDMTTTAKAAGAMFVIVKPFTVESFQAVLAPVLS
jgi:two-component system chemotaxis response regulator CheY